MFTQMRVWHAVDPTLIDAHDVSVLDGIVPSVN